MKTCGVIGILLALTCALVFGDAVERGDVVNVAIIGAGAAGSSAAYHLHQYTQLTTKGINITVFEKTNRIGGRTLTVIPPHRNTSSDTPIELGASIFIKVNHILYDATSAFNLPLVSGVGGDDEANGMGIYDGEKFVYWEDGKGWWLWDLGKMGWKYGFGTIVKATWAAKRVVRTLLRLYDDEYFPFERLGERVKELGLDEISGITGEEFLRSKNINPDFSREIIQAGSRVNYASNLATIHGVAAMVSFSTSGAVAVKGGNWQIFRCMLEHSGAALHLNTTVSSISTSSAATTGYTISTTNAGSEEEDYPVTFDKVIIASPWQFSNINAGPDVFFSTRDGGPLIEELPWTKLHVTLFTSRLRLSAEFFGLERGEKTPSSVYTVLGKDEDGQNAGVGRTGFFSVSTVGRVKTDDGGEEFVYKIFSMEKVTVELLSRLLGGKVALKDDGDDDDMLGGKEEEEQGEGRVVKLDKGGPVSWLFATWIWSYPREVPRVDFGNVMVGKGVYYTSGMEGFVSTMETSALMGKNVARLIVDEYGHGGGEGDKGKEL